MPLFSMAPFHISFKAYQNTKALRQFEKLLVYKAKEQHAPLRSAKRVKLSDDTADEPQGKAKAKSGKRVAS